MEESSTKRNFKQFRVQIERGRAPINDRVYRSGKYGYYRNNPVASDFTLDEIRPTYRFYSSCQRTVPQALEAFFESTSYEDAIRNAISIGGDSDTIGAITGAVAEAYYGIPKKIKDEGMKYLDDNFKKVLGMAYKKVQTKKK